MSAKRCRVDGSPNAAVPRWRKTDAVSRACDCMAWQLAMGLLPPAEHKRMMKRIEKWCAPYGGMRWID